MANFIKILFILLTSCTAIFAQQANSTDNNYIIQDSVSIPTKSGISISAIIVKKKTNTEPLPAVLFYTTYHQGAGDAILGKRSADKDYVGVVAYARGIRTNLNHYKPYENESTDIYDIIDWIIKQPWCNGKVGMLGGSYTGFSQWATAKKLHPALKTIIPQVAVMPGFDVPMENNVPTQNILSWPHDNIYKFPPIQKSLLFEWFESGSSFRSLDSLADHPNAIFQKWLKHPSYDKYWKSLVPTPKEYSKINIPVLSTTGYYDGAQLSALQYFKLHNKYNKNANHYFVIGPYDHFGGQGKASANLMGYEIDKIAITNMRDLAYQWLDFILKDGKKPELLKDKFNFQVMGTNEWKHAPTLEKAKNKSLKFYLNENALKSEIVKEKSYLKQVIDFKDRTKENSFYIPSIIMDTLDASNGLVFTSNAFEKEISINGSFSGNLNFTTNKKDMDVSIALYELMPDGKYFYLTRYIGRASYAKNNAKRQLLKQNKLQNITFKNTRFISKKISVGSRLVILLNINKHPFEILNYGSGKEVSDETIKDANEPMEIKWNNDSFIEIPIWQN